MSISNAIQRGNMVHIYDEHGSEKAIIKVPTGGNNGLKGWTSETVSIQTGNIIRMYNVNGNLVGDGIYADAGDSFNYDSEGGKGSWLGIIAAIAFLVYIFFF